MNKPQYYGQINFTKTSILKRPGAARDVCEKYPEVYKRTIVGPIIRVVRKEKNYK